MKAGNRLAVLAACSCALALFSPTKGFAAQVDPCATPDPVSAIDLHRSVPVGQQVARVFQLNISHPIEMQVIAPADFLPQKTGIDSENLQMLLLTAPRPGPFVVQVTWKEQYYDGNGDPQLCNASANVQMFAVANNGVKLKQSKPKKLPFRIYRTRAKHYGELNWSWKCTDESDPAPITMTLRYEQKSRGKLSKRAKTGTTTALDPCMHTGTAALEAKLPRGTFLEASIGPNDVLKRSEINIEVLMRSSVARRKVLAVHLHVVVTQGAKTLVSRRFCAVPMEYFKETTGCRGRI